jgi:hypothetical protein
MGRADVTPGDKEAPSSPPTSFYGASLTDTERGQLPAAYEMEGLAHEIAILRVKLNTALGEHPLNLKLISAGVEMLVKAVATEHRLSPRARKDLADNFAAVLNSFGDQILPADR